MTSKCTVACSCSNPEVDTVCLCGCGKCRKRRSRHNIKKNGPTKRKIDYNAEFYGPIGQCGSPITFVEFEHNLPKQGKRDIFCVWVIETRSTNLS